jgi:hypothetical protein
LLNTWWSNACFPEMLQTEMVVYMPGGVSAAILVLLQTPSISIGSNIKTAADNPGCSILEGVSAAIVNWHQQRFYKKNRC